MTTLTDRLSQTGAFAKGLHSIATALQEGDTLDEVMPRLEPSMLELIQAERMTVFSKGRYRRKLVSIAKTGSEIREIAVPLAPSSIAGFVALRQDPVLVSDAYDGQELKRVHRDLRFDRSIDQATGLRTRSVIAVPIKFKEVLLGVLQVLNRRDGGSFSGRDLRAATQLAKAIGLRFRHDFAATRNPFEHLVRSGNLTAEGRSPAELAIEDDKASPEEVGESLSRFFQVPFMAWDRHVALPDALLSTLDKSVLERGCWVPVERDDDGTVTILTDDPRDVDRVMEIERAVPAPAYAFRVGLRSDILAFIRGDVPAGRADDTHGRFDDLIASMTGALVTIEDDADPIPMLEGDDAVEMVNVLLGAAVEARASDVHLEPGIAEAPAEVRLRIDGICVPKWTLPAKLLPNVISRIKILSGLNIAERRKPQDGKCRFKAPSGNVELRIATLPTVNGEAAVIRVLRSSHLLTIDDVGFTARTRSGVVETVQHPHGLFLVVGPTGSGKTTTLHSILHHLNQPDRKIWTVEDPVEINQPRLSQLQVNPSIDITFASALVAFLRADPDVIMVGEVRDEETAHACVEAALTGHFVLSTLHTNSAPETIIRLLGLGLDPGAFAESLRGILSQRLARRLCDDCKRERLVDDEVASALVRAYGEESASELGLVPGESVVYEPLGCEACNGTGHHGRLALHEFLAAGPAVKDLIQQGAGIRAVREAAIRDGMRTLMQDGLAKVLEGMTSLQEVKRVALA